MNLSGTKRKGEGLQQAVQEEHHPVCQQPSHFADAECDTIHEHLLC